ncbi:ferritin-like domain-containing protein [Robbsia betulipollinis]|uniref:ferritin-like domain-containing protein n=1 Tax=Robbsia betulipollinis TaxID=2981849 RepID=UPI003D7BBBEF
MPGPSRSPAPDGALPEARLLAACALGEADPRRKAQAARRLYDGLRAGACAIDPARPIVLPDLPGRPERPVLVAPRELSRRGVQTLEGRVAMLHAIAHIEFNAINLALDAIARFPALPLDYYLDWGRVAAEEGYHFTLLADHLERLGGAYGAHPAHDGLWDMAVRTRGDVLARMALVPRTLEARGLDAAPPIRAKLAQAGDTVAAGILDIILRDEIVHVAIGNRWFRWLCQRAGHDPLAFYAVLARDYRAPRLKGPFNLPARRAAGFGEDELDALQRDAGVP